MSSSNKPSVLFYYAGLTNSDQAHGGSSAAMMNLASAVSSSGEFLEICATGDPTTKAERYRNVQLLQFPKSGELESFISRFDIVVIATHIREFKNCKKRPGQKWILHQHCWDIEPEELANLALFDRVIAVSALHAAYLSQKGIPSQKIYVIPNSIDPAFLNPPATTRNEFSLMFAGALVPHKGIHLLAEAYLESKVSFPKLELHLYGSGTLWHAPTEYEEMLIKMNLPGVKFHGVIPNSEMPKIYGSHSLFCLPSEMESFGLATVEAQACGCIPIVHDIGGTAATVINGRTGFLYKPNTAKALSERILFALKSADLGTMRAEAVSYAREAFSPQRAADGFIGLVGTI